MKKSGIIAHPLTLVFGCVYIFLGKQVETIVYLMVILIHEYAHYVAASFCSVKMEGVEITPFGGCLKGEMLGVSPKKTLIITLSAPLINIFSSITLFALWWIYPTIYPYTECVCYSNLAIGTINLLPCYPLDGGRAVLAFFDDKRKAAAKVVFILTVMFAVALFGMFVLSLFFTMNLSMLMMSVFLFWGAFYQSKEDERTKKTTKHFSEKAKFS